ncbi:drug/metabolite transporter (DMT)-like permease [Paenibacillus sp. DS2015]|uniref:DMT family transporter n=1 Tax=Paenibacillus sp. DS2015 TaxID=3373917 RepID=UPI003D1CAA57
MKAETWFRHPMGILISSLGATVLWGSALPIVKLSYAHLDMKQGDFFGQWVFAGYRFTMAGIILILLSTILGKNTNIGRPKLSLSRLFRLGAIQTFMQYLLLYVGLSYSSGIEGSILVGSTSFFQILTARFMAPREKLIAAKWWGLLMGFAGIVVMGFGQSGGLHFQFGIGSVLLLASAVFGGFGNVLARQESMHESVISLTGKQMLIGGLGLLLVGGVKRGFVPYSFDGQAVGLLLYLSLLSAAGFALWNTVMKYNSVGRVSMYLFFIPVFGVILSAIILQEQVSSWVGLSLLFVVAGIITVNVSGRQSKQEAQEV